MESEKERPEITCLMVSSVDGKGTGEFLFHKTTEYCLHDYFGWESTCGYLQEPPDNIQPGDVLVYHENGCGDGKSHATLVVEGGKNALIACHSSNHYGIDYNYMKNSKPYYNWLHINA